MPFDEIAHILDRTLTAPRKLASRARQRVRTAPTPDADIGRRHTVVDAFLSAARNGDLEALVATLAPDIVLHAAVSGGAIMRFRGASTVSEQAMAFSSRAEHARPALINGAAGLVVAAHGQPIAVMAFTVTDDQIAELDIYAAPQRLARFSPASINAGKSPSQRS